MIPCYCRPKLLLLAAAFGIAGAFPLAHAEPLVVDEQAMADLSTCSKPVWPKKSLRNEEQGTVTLAFLVDVNGTVAASRIVLSSGFPLLDTAAQEGLSRCKFKPRTEAGKPVAAWMQMQYQWYLEDSAFRPNAEMLAAANSGDAAAQYRLAEQYLTKRNNRENMREAIRWLKSAAASEHAQSQFELGNLLSARGSEVRDMPVAVDMYRRAAASGLVQAKFDYGTLLYTGEGISKDEAGAIAMLRDAATGGHLKSGTQFAFILLNGQPNESQMREAIPLLVRSAEGGDSMATAKLGYCYEHGIGVLRNLLTAERYYEKAIQGGFHQVAPNLAKLKSLRAAQPQ